MVMPESYTLAGILCNWINWPVSLVVEINLSETSTIHKKDEQNLRAQR